jgi:predicted SAM-dependent methyltransferase
MKNYIKQFFKKIPLLNSLIVNFYSIYQRFISRQKWARLIKNKKEIKLELGSGNKKGINGWTTVDLYYSDISWDLSKGIPLPDNCVSKIYSSHLLEHIPYNQIIILLKECRRILKAGGEFLVCVPNFKLWVDAYIEGKMFKERKMWWQPGLIDTGSAIDQLNYSAYMKDEHKYMFDEENLINTLKKAGFSNAQLRKFDENLDLQERDYESIYAIAVN